MLYQALAARVGRIIRPLRKTIRYTRLRQNVTVLVLNFKYDADKSTWFTLSIP